MKLIHKKKGMVLYLPESFEWLILQSGVIQNRSLRKILEKPFDFIESSEYFSWERFFSELLMELTKESYLKYAKRKLNQAYLQKEIAAKILEQMTGIWLQKEQ